MKTALALFFESMLGSGTSLLSMGKPCTGTGAGLGALWEGPGSTRKYCVNSVPYTVGCPLSRRDWDWYFYSKVSGPPKSCLGFVSWRHPVG